MNLHNSNKILNHHHLDTFKKNVTLTNTQLYQLSQSNQKFVATVEQLNNQATLKVTDDRPKLALIYLDQAQKILQYVASCGKNMDRNLIVSVLHNQACCYQRLWQLQICANYLQALIFNVLSHLTSQQSSQKMVYNCKRNHIKEVNQGFLTSLAGKSIKNRIQLCRYYLQYCAINSQLKQHQKALIEGQKAILILKALFKQLQYISQDKKKDLYSPISKLTFDGQQYQTKKKVVCGISQIDDQPNVNNLGDYLKTAKFFFNKWNLNKNIQKNQALQQKLKVFSIGCIMQIKPIKIRSTNLQLNRQNSANNQDNQTFLLQEKYTGNPLKMLTYETIVDMVLLLGIGYFTIGTQLRILSNSKDKKSNKPKGQLLSSKNRQYLQSQFYHLITLIITCIYIPFDMLFMRHILTSYNNHYNHDIIFDNVVEGTVMKNFDIFNIAERGKQRQSQKDEQKLKGAKKLGISNSNKIIQTDQDNTTQVKISRSKIFLSDKKMSKRHQSHYSKMIRQIKKKNYTKEKFKLQSGTVTNNKSKSPFTQRASKQFEKLKKTQPLKISKQKKTSKKSYRSKQSNQQYFKSSKSRLKHTIQKSRQKVIKSPQLKTKKKDPKNKLKTTKSQLQMHKNIRTPKDIRTPIKHNISKYYF